MTLTWQRQASVADAHGGCAWCVAWSPSGELLASCGADCRVRVFARNEDGSLVPLAETDAGLFQRTVRSISWSPGGGTLAVACFDATATILRLNGETLVPIESLEQHVSEVKSVAFGPNGSLLATCSRDKYVYIWESGLDDDFECVAVLAGHKEDVKYVRWHPSNEVLATASYDDTIRLWKEDNHDEDWYCCAQLSAHTGTVWSLAFDRHGERMASVSADGRLIVWQEVDRERTRFGSDPRWRVLWKTEPSAHAPPIYTVDWVGDRIATGGGDNTVRVFVQAGEDAFELAATISDAHDGDVNCVSWNPRDPTLLATTGDDGAVSVWRMSSS